MLALFSQGVATAPGEPGRWDSTTTGLVTRGAWAAAAGDTATARRLMATIRTRSSADIARQGFTPAVLEAWIAARGGRWQDVLEDLGPAALQGEPLGYVQFQSAPLVRWLVAEAYERLGQPDSAAAYFERAIAPPPSGGVDFAHSRMASSFGHRRLALLYARLGRWQEARRHLEIFSETFARPDPEMAPLIQDARAVLAGAGGMAKSERR
jgi:tetratricopeptide (TPR) repeat protein